jgi:hypothetical protein
MSTYLTQWESRKLRPSSVGVALVLGEPWHGDQGSEERPTGKKERGEAEEEGLAFSAFGCDLVESSLDW